MVTEGMPYRWTYLHTYYRWVTCIPVATWYVIDRLSFFHFSRGWCMWTG